jgi:hypothetical protein
MNTRTGKSNPQLVRLAQLRRIVETHLVAMEEARVTFPVGAPERERIFSAAMGPVAELAELRERLVARGLVETKEGD